MSIAHPIAPMIRHSGRSSGAEMALPGPNTRKATRVIVARPKELGVEFAPWV